MFPRYANFSDRASLPRIIALVRGAMVKHIPLTVDILYTCVVGRRMVYPAFFSRYNISNLSDIGHPLTRRAGADNTDIRIFIKLLFRKGDNENAFAYAES